METEYIIVQAGGKGTRMERLTKNKPKALVPVDNLPMIFHLFKKYPDKKYIIIGDYKETVLKKYLEAFATIDYVLVSGKGHVGTCSGLKKSLELIPNEKSFLLIWCDLVLPSEFALPTYPSNYIGISKDFPCRWKYEDGLFVEEKSEEHGVAGLFLFKNKIELSAVPEEGEFVRWLKEQKLVFEELALYRTHEYGVLKEWEKIPKMRCRPFNQISIDGDRFYKLPIDDLGQKLSQREVVWYQKVNTSSFKNIPDIYQYHPLCMEVIKGKPVYEYSELSDQKKREVLGKIVGSLKQLHSLGRAPADADSYRVAYIDKTFERLKKVEALVPFATKEIVVINGKECRNVFFHKEELKHRVMEYYPKEFVFLHGDCTFSNILLNESLDPVFIDPRGYFGITELFGDEAYDWVKLYYSLFSNYDQFNLKRFRLEIKDDSVSLDIDSNKWESLESFFFELLQDRITKKQMLLLLAVIWLSLTTYAWEDYDSICGAFYNGLYYLEESNNVD